MAATALAVIFGGNIMAQSNAKNAGTLPVKMEKLNLTKKWDKVFPKSDKVDHKKVTFHNRFGITLAADMYTPKVVSTGGVGNSVASSTTGSGKLPAIAVSGPFGAVKEQSSGLYAQAMAERGYVAIAFDPSFTGESGGYPRDTNSPDINTDDFQSAVDFLSTQENVDPDRIGIIGICGWGGMALNIAALDTRIKATAAITMYDMSRVTAFGYYDSMDEDARYEARKALNAQRTAEYKKGVYEKPVTDINAPTPDDAPQFVKDYAAYYAPYGRAYHPRSLNFNRGWLSDASSSLVNTKLLAFSQEIRSPVLIVHGENAHSRYFGEDAFKNMTTGTGEKWAANKELYIVPGASHTDLYDGGADHNKIPWSKIEEFFKKNFK